MTELGPIESWNPGTGPVTVWTASAWSRGQMRTARKDPLPPSAQQAQHLMLAHYAAGIGRELPRLMIVSWYEEGICDLTAMTEAINIHVRRHDTYRSAFEIDDHNTVQRRTLDTPDGVEFIPTAAGFMTNKQIRAHALSSTPATLDWDCFTFGMIQHADHFTVYASIDHLHIDGTSAGLIFGDIHLSYRALVHGLPNPLPPISGYRRYTARQQARIAAATPDSPQITGWLDFARNGDWPGFPLPLGDTAGEVSGTSRGGWVTLDLLDAEATDAFDTACRAAGARFSGGVMACAALAEHELTGTTTYRGLTPSDTRAGAAEALSVGWYASLFPVTVPIGDGDFSAAARAAQDSFDANRALAAMPFHRALELAPAGQASGCQAGLPPMMLSYQDFRKIPAAGRWEDTRFGTFGDNISLGGINLWVNRHPDRTTVTVSFPDNPTARHSVHRYLAALSRAFAGAAEIAADWVTELIDRVTTSTRCAVCAGSQ